MPFVRVIKNHVANGAIRRVGEQYQATETQANERSRVGLVELVDAPGRVPAGIVAKVEYSMYAPREFTIAAAGDESDPEPVHIVRRAGSWWFFSDDTKVLGKSAAAEKLDVTLEVFEVEHEPRFA